MVGRATVILAEALFCALRRITISPVEAPHGHIRRLRFRRQSRGVPQQILRVVYLQAIIHSSLAVGQLHTNVLSGRVDNMKHVLLRNMVIHFIAHVINGYTHACLLIINHDKAPLSVVGGCCSDVVGKASG